MSQPTQLNRLALSVLFSTSLLSVAGASAQTCQTSTPTWAEEFDGSQLDLNKWEIMTGDGCAEGICGWGNDELQSYQADNLSVSNGVLTITARKERIKSKQYTSGRIRTANMPAGGEWTHGRFEARIKLPDGTGMWPAFWMLPTNPDVGWPMSGEIDIMEATGQADMFAFGTIHYGQAWPDNEWTSGRILKQPDAWSDAFHEYAVEWEPNEMRWYVDDILYSVKTPDDLSDSSYWTFEDYQYHFILNLAVGGSLGGEVDDSMLPQTMQVDYVRVYNTGQPALTGEHIVEPNTTHTYQITGEHGTSSSYQWTTPTGETSTTDTVTVNWGTTGGTVTVDLDNSCGSRQLAMDVHVLPEQSQQHVFDDYESQRNISYTGWDGDFIQQAANPLTDSVNGSATVAQYTRDAATLYDTLAGTTSAISDASPFISGESAIYLDVFTQAPVGTEILVQLEDSSTATADNYPSGRHSKYVAHTDVQGQWQRLRFTLEDRIDGATTDADVDSVILLIAPNSANGDTYYLDNFEIKSASGGDGGSGGDGSGDDSTASAMYVDTITTATQSAGRGQKYGVATVTITDDLGNPVEGASVSGTFSGDLNESVSGQTDAQGQAQLTTSTTAGGNVSFSFCVDSLSGSLTHDTASSTGLCQ